MAAVDAVVTPPVVTTSNVATRFDTVATAASAAPGTAITLSLYPNGTWPTSGTLTPASSGTGTFSVASVSVAGGTSPLTLTYTPTAAGEHNITWSTGPLAIRAPYQHPINSFALTSGSVVSLTQSASHRDQRTFQQDVWSGSPSGFSGINGATFANGWGEFFLPIQPASAISGLFARLVDAYSAGATSSGGGTVISNVRQVYGPISGSKTARLLLPASDYCVYLEVASDQAMTSPVRVPIRFFVRDVAMAVTRSMENMLFGAYAEGVPGNTNWSTYTKTAGIGAQNPNGIVDAAGAWLRCDGSQSYGNYGQVFGGVGAQELGRLFAAKKGTGLGILGMTPAGGNLDDFWGADGTPAGAITALMAEAGNKARYLVFQGNGWSGNYASESVAMYRQVYHAIPTRMMGLYPSIAVVSGNSASGNFGDDGSRAAGYTRQNGMVRETELLDPSVTAAEAGADWNSYYSNSGHADWASAIRYARSRARSMLLAEVGIASGYGLGYADRYVRFSTVGTMAAGSGIIKVPYLLPAGATKLVAWRWSNGVTSSSGWSYTTPAPADLARIITVYQGAAGTRDSGASLVAVSGATIDTTAQTLNISVPTGTVGPVTVHIMADFARNGSTDGSWCVAFFDDRALGDGCGYGPGARSQLDIAVS